MPGNTASLPIGFKSLFRFSREKCTKRGFAQPRWAVETSSSPTAFLVGDLLRVLSDVVFDFGLAGFSAGLVSTLNKRVSSYG